MLELVRFMIAPPSAPPGLTELPESVLLMIVNVATFAIAPPWLKLPPLAELPESVLLVIVSVPLL